MNHIRTLRRLTRDRHGGVALEFALVSPALFFLMYGMIEFGRLMWTQESLNFAVEDAARCASASQSVCGTATQITNYAAADISTSYVPASAFTSTAAACGHQVTASFVYPFVVTGLFTMTPTLSASACFP